MHPQLLPVSHCSPPIHPMPITTLNLSPNSCVSTAFLYPEGLSQGTGEGERGQTQKASVMCLRYRKGNLKNSVKLRLL